MLLVYHCYATLILEQPVSVTRFAILGTGFWSSFQLAGWCELSGVRCVALYNRTRQRADELGAAFGIDAVYSDAEQLMAEQDLDFVDVITSNDTHEYFVKLAARHGLPVICQKPFAESVEQAERMIDACTEAGVSLSIHENWRWQHAIRVFREQLNSGVIGRLTRSRIHYCSSFPVIENQPFLKELQRFILMDVGTHLLDASRFLFGEVESVYCTIDRVNQEIRGEDMATVAMKLKSGPTVLCEISYGSITEIERFPETYLYAEGSDGFLELGPDFWIRRTTREGTFSRRYPPPVYSWADPAYACIHSSIVDCNRDLLRSIQTGRPAETDARGNLETLRLVEACYESASENRVVAL